MISMALSTTSTRFYGRQRDYSISYMISVSLYSVFRAWRHVSDIKLISDLPCYAHPLNATKEA